MLILTSVPGTQTSSISETHAVLDHMYRGGILRSNYGERKWTPPLSLFLKHSSSLWHHLHFYLSFLPTRILCPHGIIHTCHCLTGHKPKEEIEFVKGKWKKLSRSLMQKMEKALAFSNGLFFNHKYAVEENLHFSDLYSTSRFWF